MYFAPEQYARERIAEMFRRAGAPVIAAEVEDIQAAVAGITELAEGLQEFGIRRGTTPDGQGTRDKHRPPR